MQYTASQIRNICLMGHGGDGKTSLAEALLFFTKGTDRLGKTADGNTVCDFDPEEIKRKISISTAVAPVEWKNTKINILDTPGYFDFEGEVRQALSAVETALIVVSAKDGVNVGTEKAFKLAKAKGVPVMFFITKADEENANFDRVFEELQEKFGTGLCAVNIPLVSNGKAAGYYNLIDEVCRKSEGGKLVDAPVPGDAQAEISKLKDVLNEAIAATDDELMEKFFEGEEFTKDEIRKGVELGLKGETLVPVLCGSSVTFEGIPSLLDFIAHYVPAPKDDSSADPALFVFKTIADPFVGKMSFFKVLSGNISAGITLSNPRSGSNEKLGRIFTIKGKTQTEVDGLCCGDIGVVNKLVSTGTGDVLCTAGANVEVKPIEYPKPCFSRAILPKAKGDEEKISLGLQRLAEEDPTFSYVNNAETHEQVISGMGDTHLDVIVSKLKSKFNVGVDLKEPRVPYREAIRKKVRVQGKHKKQSGGHGQYGDVWIEFEPYDGDELLFEENVFGGAVPRNFFPAVEKGLRECANKGVLAGYPVVGLKATLVDGSYHPVDSSEMSFKMAASIAYKEGLKQAQPTILEPIGKLKVLIPDSLMGDIMGDISKRRGAIIGMTPSEERGMQEVQATVPMSEMASYATDLRSMTRGRGSFDLEFDSYQIAPDNVAQQIIEDAKKDAEEE
ncbi:MAG: elongation factor G [Clostridia bacterium]|nr:elongation factor G [Clostridia bacterium]